MKKLKFSELKVGCTFYYNNIMYSKLSQNMTYKTKERCNIARNGKINAVRVDKTNGFWFSDNDIVEIEQK
jgi:hypothetical protein